ncbi:MAG: hypothetical protein ABI641_12095 [Caldimonas sp.]
MPATFAPDLAPDLALVANNFAPRPNSDPHRGPGWFDSSWELHRGCEVHEGWPADAPLDDWIDGYCQSDLGSAAGSAPSGRWLALPEGCLSALPGGAALAWSAMPLHLV